MSEKQKETNSAEYLSAHTEISKLFEEFYLQGHADGWEKGYEMGFKTQPDLNRKYMAKQIEELKKRAKRWEELAKR